MKKGKVLKKIHENSFGLKFSEIFTLTVPNVVVVDIKKPSRSKKTPFQFSYRLNNFRGPSNKG
jgi:hypothetical protein